MTIFRPMIDLHHGLVKKLVGGTVDTHDEHNYQLRTNFKSLEPAESFARLYKKHNLSGGHVVKLGPGNEEACRAILYTWPDAFQVGGDINPENATEWIEKGAQKVIVCSYLFPEGQFSMERLKEMNQVVGKDKLVLDLSCRKRVDPNGAFIWIVAMNKWHDLTSLQLTKETIEMLKPYCSEFLVHAVDVEGMLEGIDKDLVTNLGEWCDGFPCTYAGGSTSRTDLARVNRLSKGRVDLTFGSALDIFGGNGVTLDECVSWNQMKQHHQQTV